MLFTTGMCTIGFGAQKVREDPKVYNTNQENNMMKPGVDVLESLAHKCLKSRICVDIYITHAGNQALDLPSLEIIPALTGGDIFKYTNFDPNR